MAVICRPSDSYPITKIITEWWEAPISRCQRSQVSTDRRQRLQTNQKVMLFKTNLVELRGCSSINHTSKKQLITSSGRCYRPPV